MIKNEFNKRMYSSWEMNFAIFSAIILTIVLFQIYIGANPITVKEDLQELKELRNLTQNRAGFITIAKGKELKYSLRTFDAGRNWYVIVPNSDSNSKEVVILGHIDKIYPGLKRHLEKGELLTVYLKRSFEKESNVTNETISQHFDVYIKSKNDIKDCSAGCK